MGMMSALAIEIEEMLFKGASHQDIADQLDLSLAQVEAYVELLEDADRDYEYDDSMDGDAQSALASAGWGTDEDYGVLGDEY